MSRKENHYRILEASEHGPWIRHERGMFYACTVDENPTLYSAGEEFNSVRKAVKWISQGQELFTEKDIALFEALAEVADNFEMEFEKKWKQEHWD